MTSIQWMVAASVVGMLVSAWMLWGGWAALFAFCVSVLIVYHLGKHS